MLKAATTAEFAASLPRGTVGVALTLNRVGGTHVGIIYRDVGVVLLCHMAGPYDLRNEPPSDRYLWERAALRERRSQIFLSYLRLIIKNNGKTIPYGFGYEGSYLDDDGNFIRADDPGAGLNCATFIMAVYQSLKIPLLQEETWAKRPEDAEARQKLIDELIRWDPDVDLQRMKPFIEGVRFRPEEVAAGTISSLQPPIHFDVVEPSGKLLEEFVRGRLG